MKTPLFKLLYVSAFLLASSSTILLAQTLYWDPNGATAGVGGTGSWLATDVWSDNSLGGPYFEHMER